MHKNSRLSHFRLVPKPRACDYGGRELDHAILSFARRRIRPEFAGGTVSDSDSVDILEFELLNWLAGISIRVLIYNNM